MVASYPQIYPLVHCVVRPTLSINNGALIKKNRNRGSTFVVRGVFGIVNLTFLERTYGS